MVVMKVIYDSWHRLKLEGKLPTRRLKRTKAQDREYRALLLQLKEMGVLVGCIDDPPGQPSSLTVEQIDHEFAKLYELPWGEVAIVVLAKLTVLKAGILITDSEVTTPWDGLLELGDPTESTYYEDLIRGLPSYPPTFSTIG
jgi:hypothetical protein